ncbi:hypothetical protein THAOC_28710, partial [Thalassiosira oceanica]
MFLRRIFGLGSGLTNDNTRHIAFWGVLQGYLRDPSNPSAPPSSVPLTLGLYVDDFVFFSESDEVEARFERLLGEQVPVDFMGVVEWFLGIQFSWSVTPDLVRVHLCQAGFAANLVESYDYHLKRPTPDATPYRSGIPIDSIESAPTSEFGS